MSMGGGGGYGGGSYGGRDQNGYGGYGQQMPQMGSPRPGGNMYQSWMGQRPQQNPNQPIGTTGGNMGTDYTGRFFGPPGAITNQGMSGGNMFQPNQLQHPGAMTGGNMNQPGMGAMAGGNMNPQQPGMWDPRMGPEPTFDPPVDPRSQWMGRNPNMLGAMPSGPFTPRY